MQRAVGHLCVCVCFQPLPEEQEALVGLGLTVTLWANRWP